MLDRLLAWAVQRAGTVLVGVLLLIIAGVWSATHLKVDAFPDLTDVQVSVLIEAPGLSPLEVERLVSYPIEVALNGLPRVTRVRSTSKYALSAITVQFEDGVDLYFARTLVAERVQGVRAELPAGADAQLGPLSGATSEIYLYTLESDSLDQMALRTLHDRVVRPQLRAIAGVTEINSFGGEVRQLQVTIRPERLLAFGLTLHDVVEAIQANNSVAAGGYLERGDEQYILRGLGQARDAEDLRQTVIRASAGGVPVILGDIASIDFGAEVRQGAVSRDGTGEVVSGIVMMLRGENSREVVRRVRERVAAVNAALPAHARLAPYYDQSDLVEGTLRTVEHNLALGGFLVVAILLAFLGNVRAALIVAATIPLSLLTAIVGMRWLGISANLMSLGAIDFGMIVDGAVVMTEHAVRRMHEDAERGKFPTDRPGYLRMLIESIQDVGRPIAFGVLIILLVYIPILTLEGLEGRMFRPMALTVAMALFGSLLLTLLFVPAAMRFAFRSGPREARFSLRIAATLDRWYKPLVEQTVHQPLLAITAALLLLVAGGLIAPRLGSEFLPELDEGSILIQSVRDPSVSLTTSVAMQGTMERALRKIPEVTTVVSRTGRADVATDPMGINQADVFVMLKPKGEWRRGVSKDSLQREMEAVLEDEVPGMAFGFTQPVAMRLSELISGVRADLAVKVFGDSTELNRAIAEQVAATIARVPGASEVSVEATQGQGYLNVRMHRDVMARFGIPVREVQEAIETAVGGRPVSQIIEGSYAVDVTVQYPPELKSSPAAIGAITIPTPHGARIALSQLADITLESGPVQLSRESAQRLVVVQANVDGRDLGGFVAEVRERVAAEVMLPKGMFLVYGGQFENQARALARLQLVVPLSIGLIALLLYASLQSWSLTGIVLVNLPFAAVGGILALWLRGLHLSVSASIGFIALFGVAVLNGLVLLSTIQRRHRDGAAGSVAAIEGARERLRPVLMTALVASIGFIPVALSTGTGAEVQRPLATVVIGGLVTSTLLTLLLVPALAARVLKEK
jgi:cobalt-zinc-cadmium resistance protein CzcA